MFPRLLVAVTYPNTVYVKGQNVIITLNMLMLAFRNNQIKQNASV